MNVTLFLKEDIKVDDGLFTFIFVIGMLIFICLIYIIMRCIYNCCCSCRYKIKDSFDGVV